MSTFVDTSVWFAAANRHDRQNARAKKILSGIAAPVMTDHILVETWHLLNSRVHRRAADQFWLQVRRGVADLQTVLPVDFEAAWAIGDAFGDQDFSIVDRTSFAVMERLAIHQAASFDDHFAIYRYGRDRNRAFDVLR